MDMYEVELESAEPDCFAVTVPAFPGLLILGASLEEALARARASSAFHVRARDAGQLSDKIALVPSTDRGLRASVASATQPSYGIDSSDRTASSSAATSHWPTWQT
jgi:predicted RNase H-like HicB family nuclease